jgi:hypothetical protein
MSSDEVSTSKADNAVGTRSPAFIDPSVPVETGLEVYSDYALGLAFLVTAAIAFRRMRANRSNTSTNGSSGAAAASAAGGAETTVVTAFYSLIFCSAGLRSLYFLIPATVWQPSYTPSALYAWDNRYPWFRYTLSELTVTAGSLTLFSIFILILVYWADILKKYYNPGSRRSVPMATFLSLVAALVGFELLNLILFLSRQYTTEGMILFNAILLSVTSIVCVAEITIFSNKFQNVLQTLGAINQVSTDSQVRRIVWITVTGNLFFCSRAILETVFAGTLLVWWYKTGSVAYAFSHLAWDIYTLVKYISELTILALMLHILQSRFSGNAAAPPQQQGYTKVPEAAVSV